MDEPPIPVKDESMIHRLRGRDCIQPVVIAKKVNEVIDKLEELCNELIKLKVLDK